MTGRVIVVGGGVLGVMHALMAQRHGFEVVHLERDLAARGASVRNFGLVWVGGRAGGAELELALRARWEWDKIAASVPGLSFRPAGSVTVASGEAELTLMEQACQLNNVAGRQWRLLDGPGARAANPELSEAVSGALWCGADAIVEPRATVAALVRYLSGQDGYSWLPGRAVVDLADGAVLDDAGRQHRGDWVFLCTGATFPGLVARYVDRPLTRPVRLQMLETGPYPGQLTTAVADGDSMRYYPAFDVPARSALAPQDEVAAGAGAQLLMVQRVDGSLTIGDTHDYTEPFPFDLEEGVYHHLVAKAGRLLRRPIPPVARRWAGVYSETIDKKNALYWRQEILPKVEIVSGPGGRGMTCSPAIAEDSLSSLVARLGR